MPSAAKAKGNAFERELCGFFGSVFGGNFQRVPNSGAFTGGTNAFRKNVMSANQRSIMKSDIIPPENMRRLNVEAKSYKDFLFHQTWNGSCPQLDLWIAQTEASEDPGDLSFTIFKITRRGTWVVFKEGLKDMFLLNSYMTYAKSNTERYIIADHESFFIQNREKIMELSA